MKIILLVILAKAGIQGTATILINTLDSRLRGNDK